MNLLTATENILSETEYNLAVDKSNEDKKKAVRLWHLDERAILGKLYKEEGMWIVFKDTALGIPQQNKRAKVQFVTLYG